MGTGVLLVLTACGGSVRKILKAIKAKTMTKDQALMTKEIPMNQTQSWKRPRSFAGRLRRVFKARLDQIKTNSILEFPASGDRYKKTENGNLVRVETREEQLAR